MVKEPEERMGTPDKIFLVTKHDTAAKYPDTTEKSVMTDHFSIIPIRH